MFSVERVWLVTVGRLELERLSVLVGDSVGGRVESHAASEDERLSGKALNKFQIANQAE